MIADMHLKKRKCYSTDSNDRNAITNAKTNMNPKIQTLTDTK